MRGWILPVVVLGVIATIADVAIGTHYHMSTGQIVHYWVVSVVCVVVAVAVGTKLGRRK